MAKGASSGGKAGCGYASGKAAGYSAGRAGGSPLLYAGRAGIGAGKPALPGSPAYFGGNSSYQKGYRIGSDGASLMGSYNPGKDATEKIAGSYMRSQTGEYHPSVAMREGAGLYSSNLGDAATMENLRHRANEPSDEAGVCMKCGAPAAKGAPLCLNCMAGSTASYPATSYSAKSYSMN